MQGGHRLQLKHDQAQALQDHLQHLPMPFVSHAKSTINFQLNDIIQLRLQVTNIPFRRNMTYDHQVFLRCNTLKRLMQYQQHSTEPSKKENNLK